MTADTRLSFISPEDGAKTNLFCSTILALNTCVCSLIWFQHHLLSASRQLSSSQVTLVATPFVKTIGCCYIHYLVLGILIGCCYRQSFSASAPDAGRLRCLEQPVFVHVMSGDLLLLRTNNLYLYISLITPQKWQLNHILSD